MGIEDALLGGRFSVLVRTGEDREGTRLSLGVAFECVWDFRLVGYCGCGGIGLASC